MTWNPGTMQDFPRVRVSIDREGWQAVIDALDARRRHGAGWKNNPSDLKACAQVLRHRHLWLPRRICSSTPAQRQVPPSLTNKQRDSQTHSTALPPRRYE